MRFDNILPINIITKLHALALVTPRLHQFKPSLKFMAARRRGKKHKCLIFSDEGLTTIKLTKRSLIQGRSIHRNHFQSIIYLISTVIILDI